MPHHEEKNMYGLKLGQSAQCERVFTNADVREYVDLTHDNNPVYLDAAGYEQPVLPKPLLAGMFSDLLGTQLPGRGTGWLKQKLTYPQPAYVGENITASVTITRLRADKEIVNLATRCVSDDRKIVCEGEALVLVRNLENKAGQRFEAGG
jgi:acyl dehydratase